MVVKGYVELGFNHTVSDLIIVGPNTDSVFILSYFILFFKKSGMLYVDFVPDIHIEEVKRALFHHRDQLAVCISSYFYFLLSQTLFALFSLN